MRDGGGGEEGGKGMKKTLQKLTSREAGQEMVFVLSLLKDCSVDMDSGVKVSLSARRFKLHLVLVCLSMLGRGLIVGTR